MIHVITLTHLEACRRTHLTRPLVHYPRPERSLLLEASGRLTLQAIGLIHVRSQAVVLLE
jgi:hypothetical protein